MKYYFNAIFAPIGALSLDEKLQIKYVRFEVFTAVTMKKAVFLQNVG
jgi:hypothetical protein